MKKILAILLVVGLNAEAASLVTVTGHVYRAVSQPVTNRVIKFTPESTPLADSPLLVLGDVVTATSTPPVGFFTIDLVQGIYLVEGFGNRRDSFRITIPADTIETNHIETYVTSGATTNFVAGDASGWTKTASDARYILKTNSWGTGTTFTNIVLNPGYSTNGYIWTASDTNGNGYWATNSGSGGASTAYLQLEDGDLLEPE